MIPRRHQRVLPLTIAWSLSIASVSSLGAAAKPHVPVKRTAASGISATGHVTEVRFWSLGEATRIAIELDSEFQYKADRLSNPDRLFFDIAGVKPQVRKGIQTIPVGDPLVKQIRVAETLPGTTRIVLDLESSADFNVSQLSNPERLMIEIRPASRKVSPLAAAPAPTSPPAPARTPVEPAPRKIFTPPPPVIASRASRSAPKIDAPPRLSAKLEAPSLPLNWNLPPAIPPRDIAAPAGAATATRESASGFKEANREKSKPAAVVPPPSPKTAEAVPLPAKKSTSGEPSLTRALGLKLGKIVIDAGHGGQDGGTRGPAGLLEKDLVLDVARRLGALIENRLGSEVIYTRSDDSYIGLEQRSHIANESKADLFISVHANSSSIKTISGVETYYLNFTTSRAALELAARENAGSERSIYDLKDLLQKIALKDKVDESREFAAKVQNSLSALSSRNNAHSRDRGVKKAPFVVLIGTSMPSILAEVGFVTNAHDETLMKKPEHRQKIAEALYRGISQYASGLSHFQVAQRKAAAE